MIDRRALLKASLCLIAAPAIVRFSSLMPVKVYRGWDFGVEVVTARYRLVNLSASRYEELLSVNYVTYDELTRKFTMATTDFDNWREGVTEIKEVFGVTATVPDSDDAIYHYRPTSGESVTITAKELRLVGSRLMPLDIPNRSFNDPALLPEEMAERRSLIDFDDA